MTEQPPQEQNNLMRAETGVTQGTNVMGNLFSLSDVLSSHLSPEEMEKVHQRQKK